MLIIIFTWINTTSEPTVNFKKNQCIDTSDANYSSLAHENYYPNGGGQQPHCHKLPDCGCNHWRVIDYYAESF